MLARAAGCWVLFPAPAPATATTSLRHETACDTGFVRSLRTKAMAGVRVLLALGLGAAEVARAYVARTGLGAMVAARLHGGRASDRLQRFGEARTIASAKAAPIVPFPAPDETPASFNAATVETDERSESHSTLAAAARIVEGFGSGLGSPALLRLDTPHDLAEFARTSRAGDLWLRLSDFDGWPDRSERRDALVEAIAAHPEWDDRAVYEAGTLLALWDDDGAFAVHRARNRKRVRRLRAAVSDGLVHLDEVRAARDDTAREPAEHGDHTAA
jgi:hypothetical protein